MEFVQMYSIDILQNATKAGIMCHETGSKQCLLLMHVVFHAIAVWNVLVEVIRLDQNRNIQHIWLQINKYGTYVNNEYHMRVYVTGLKIYNTKLSFYTSSLLKLGYR